MKLLPIGPRIRSSPCEPRWMRVWDSKFGQQHRSLRDGQEAHPVAMRGLSNVCFLVTRSARFRKWFGSGCLPKVCRRGVIESDLLNGSPRLAPGFLFLSLTDRAYFCEQVECQSRILNLRSALNLMKRGGPVLGFRCRDAKISL